MAEIDRERGTTGDVNYLLQDIDFPASRGEILAHVKARGADIETLQNLGDLPDTRYESVADVIRAVGGAESGGMPA